MDERKGLIRSEEHQQRRDFDAYVAIGYLPKRMIYTAKFDLIY